MSLPLSNLPLPNDEADLGKKFFNTYYEESIAIPSNIIDASIGFFTSRGFSESAARAVATVLISQAKIDNINVFQLLDTLKKLNEIQLSTVVREILNNYRLRISTLGTKIDIADKVEYEKRNIIP